MRQSLAECVAYMVLTCNSTDRADWATALAMRLGDALKLHLLQAVQVGDEQAWFCTPLN